MPRTKEKPTATPQTTAPPSRGAVERLRVRHSGGLLVLPRVTGTLGELRRRIERELKGKVATASFRDADGRTRTLIADGDFAAGGALLIGPDTEAASILSGDDTLNVSTARDAKEAETTSAKKKSQRSGKKRAASALGTSPLPPGKKSDYSRKQTMDAMAQEFVSASASAPESLISGATSLYVTQQGALRADAINKSLVELVKETPKTLTVSFKRAKRAKASIDEVRLLSPEECVELAARVLYRHAGSKRRRESCDTPPTRLLSLDSVATRCPALLWSLWRHSLASSTDHASQTATTTTHVQGAAAAAAASSDDAAAAPLAADVPYMLEHVTQAAIAKFHAIVQAEKAAGENKEEEEEEEEETPSAGAAPGAESE